MSLSRGKGFERKGAPKTPNGVLSFVVVFRLSPVWAPPFAQTQMSVGRYGDGKGFSRTNRQRLEDLRPGPSGLTTRKFALITSFKWDSPLPGGGM